MQRETRPVQRGFAAEIGSNLAGGVLFQRSTASSGERGLHPDQTTRRVIENPKGPAPTRRGSDPEGAATAAAWYLARTGQEPTHDPELLSAASRVPSGRRTQIYYDTGAPLPK